jgi:hypothetical protein
LSQHAKDESALQLRDGLINFVLLQPTIGYVQGMNDLLSRFIIVFNGDVVCAPAALYSQSTIVCTGVGFLVLSQLYLIGA